VSDLGELGPLDVQFRKKDELFEASSGLDIQQSLSMIQDRVMATFRDYLFGYQPRKWIGYENYRSTRFGEACKIVAPITNQIDPMRLGE